MTKTQMWDMQIRSEALRMARDVAAKDASITEVLANAKTYYEFLKGELPNE